MASLRDALARLFSSPRMLVALGAVSVGGAAAGMAIGDSPVLSKGIGGELPLARSADSALFGEYEPEGEAPPDHYPLVTPQGTVPVAELALRGRLRNSRDAWHYEEPEYIPAASDYPDQYSVEELEQLAAWEPAPPPIPQAARTSRAEADDEVVEVAVYRGTEEAVETIAEKTPPGPSPAPVATNQVTVSQPAS